MKKKLLPLWTCWGKLNVVVNTDQSPHTAPDAALVHAPAPGAAPVHAPAPGAVPYVVPSPAPFLVPPYARPLPSLLAANKG